MNRIPQPAPISKTAAISALRVVRLRCEYGTNPLGIDCPNPRLFWELESRERGQFQKAWRVLAASSPDRLARDEGDLWDSGRVESDRTAFIPYAGRSLRSSTGVYWKTRVWDGEGRASQWSAPAAWVMGLLEARDWKGQWIAAKGASESLLLRNEFILGRGIKRAVVHVTGVGHYRLYINGKPATDDMLTPGWTNYAKLILYNTYDVSALVRSGKNAAGILLGNGFYRIEQRDRFTKLAGSYGPLKAKLHLHIEYDNGDIGHFGTDASWRTNPGPITTGNIYAGEDYDARLLPAGWDRPGFDDHTWGRSVEIVKPMDTLRGYCSDSEPLRTTDAHPVVDIKKFTDGSAVYDFGQNASHLPIITVSGPAGSIVRITPSEIVNVDGTINRNTMDAGKRGSAWWQYTKATGGEETWMANFYYVGCRYAKIEFFGSEDDLPLTVPLEDSTDRSDPVSRPRNPAVGPLPQLESIVMAVVHANAKPLGEFKSSNPLLNDVRNLVRWAQRSNMMSVLSDCPQREKLGWLEQYHLNGPSIRYEFDVARIYTKGMGDMALAQTDDGLIPNIAPEYTVFPGAFRAAAEWGASFFIVPWQQYEFLGDGSLIEKYYPAMKKYFCWLEERARDDMLEDGLGDWFDIGPERPWTPQNTPAVATTTAFFYYDAKLLASTAEFLGFKEDAALYASRAEKIRISYNRKFFNAAEGVYATGSQAANAIPLALGMAEAAHRPKLLEAIVRDVERRGYTTTAGDIGHRFVLRALADSGRSDIIYKMVCQEEKPGYAYQLRRGATSLTEAWDANSYTSHNHFMLGHVTEWLYHDLAGIGFDPGSAGFKHIIIRPAILDDLAWVEASYHSMRGPICVRWEQNIDSFKLNVEIPPNTTATIFLPAANLDEVREGGGALVDNPCLAVLENGAAVLSESGCYEFIMPPVRRRPGMHGGHHVPCGRTMHMFRPY